MVAKNLRFTFAEPQVAEVGGLRPIAARLRVLRLLLRLLVDLVAVL